mmetsp:Transcript_3054/g.8292  ORF Transcript_3054/g.8292 Transcript_3054/m.8292 type:complete len:256 (+) Transcript_3054:932-1699(+)
MRTPRFGLPPRQESSSPRAPTPLSFFLLSPPYRPRVPPLSTSSSFAFAFAFAFGSRRRKCLCLCLCLYPWRLLSYATLNLLLVVVVVVVRPRPQRERPRVGAVRRRSSFVVRRRIQQGRSTTKGVSNDGGLGRGGLLADLEKNRAARITTGLYLCLALFLSATCARASHPLIIFWKERYALSLGLGGARLVVAQRGRERERTEAWVWTTPGCMRGGPLSCSARADPVLGRLAPRAWRECKVTRHAWEERVTHAPR